MGNLSFLEQVAECVGGPRIQRIATQLSEQIIAGKITEREARDRIPHLAEGEKFTADELHEEFERVFTQQSWEYIS